LTYFISPEASRRGLKRDIAFVKGLARPEIRTVGRFHYSVEAELSNVILRAYTEGEIELSRVDLRSDVRIVNREPDLAQFSMEALSPDIVVRRSGVVWASFSQFRPEDFRIDLAETLMERLNEIFSQD
jgi:hypothetical protein